jgi:adsorption protein B
LVMRYIIRLGACFQVYGSWDPLGIALRWPLALYINMAAVFHAWVIYVGVSQFATKPIVWSKTAHELPDDFMSAKR